MTPMIRVYLVRHGRTALNEDGVLRGRLDPPLDETGRREAEQLADLLARWQQPIVAVVSSPLLARCADREAVAMVAHDAVNRAVLADMDAGRRAPDVLPQPTGCCNVLDRDGGHWSIAAVGLVPGSTR